MASVSFASCCQPRLHIFNPLALSDSLVGGWGGGGVSLNVPVTMVTQFLFI